MFVNIFFTPTSTLKIFRFLDCGWGCGLIEDTDLKYDNTSAVFAPSTAPLNNTDNPNYINYNSSNSNNNSNDNTSGSNSIIVFKLDKACFGSDGSSF